MKRSVVATRSRRRAAADGPQDGQRGRSVLFPWLVVGAALVVALAARLIVTAVKTQPDLPELGHVPPFVLVDSNSVIFSSTALASEVWVASFIYTTCPGPCPRVVERLAQIRRQFPGEPKLKIVSFTVDPEADTPEVLAAYGRTHAIDPAGWKLLTGKADDVYKLIRNAFHLGVEQNTGDEAADDGAVVHSTRLVLVGPDMQIRGYYDSNDPEAMRRIVADITRLLSQRAP